MRTKTKVRIVDLVATVLVAVGILLFGKAVMSTTLPAADKASMSASVKSPAAQPQPILTLADFADLLDKRLQGKPEALPPAPEPTKSEAVTQAKPAATPAVQLPPMTLTAILHSSSFSLATFDFAGESFVAAVGEEIAGVRVTGIQPNSVKLAFRGQEFFKTLEN